jgi:hypothetical protein
MRKMIKHSYFHGLRDDKRFHAGFYVLGIEGQFKWIESIINSKRFYERAAA